MNVNEMISLKTYKPGSSVSRVLLYFMKTDTYIIYNNPQEPGKFMIESTTEFGDKKFIEDHPTHWIPLD